MITVGRTWRWVRRGSVKTAAVMRGAISVVLALQIIYTPIHLAAEPHSTGVCFEPALVAASNPPVLVGEEGRDGGEHHERHSASLHKLKVTQPSRELTTELAVAVPAECVEAPRAGTESRGLAYTGLSPPGLSSCWQFLFRAALLARAPSILS